MAIKLIITDLDGTLLLPGSFAPSPRTEKALRAASDRGVLLVPATGRVLAEVPEWLFERPYVHYISSSNGSLIVNTRTGETVSHTVMPHPMVTELLRMSEPYACYRHIFSGGLPLREDRYGEPGDRHRDGPGSIHTDMITFLAHRPELPVEKVDIYYRNPEDRRAVLDQLTTFPGITVGAACPENIEINGTGGDKGGALATLCRLLDIAPEETMCLGDGLNDLSMFKVAGLGIAMGNAAPELKAVATVVTADCGEDGAAQAIERYVLN